MEDFEIQIIKRMCTYCARQMHSALGVHLLSTFYVQLLTYNVNNNYHKKKKQFEILCYIVYLTQNGPIFTVAMHVQTDFFDFTKLCVHTSFGNAKRIEIANDQKTVWRRIIR